MRPTTPRTLDWIDHAPVSVTRTRVVAASPDAVWDVIADHTAWPDWFAGLRRVDVGSTSTGVGGTRTVHLTGLSVSEEFLAWDPGAHFAFTVTGTSRTVVRSMIENVELSRSGAATAVSYTMALDPIGGRLTAVALRPVVGVVLQRGLAGLARVAEASE